MILDTSDLLEIDIDIDIDTDIETLIVCNHYIVWPRYCGLN